LGKNIALVEMMYKTNVIVLVYEQQRNKVVIWDDHEKKNRTEITFNANQLIMNVKLRKDMMIVILNEKAFIFNFVTLKLIEQVDTFPNPAGLCALSQAEKPISKIICLPHQDKGSLKVLNYGKSIISIVLIRINRKVVLCEHFLARKYLQRIDRVLKTLFWRLLRFCRVINQCNRTLISRHFYCIIL